MALPINAKLVFRSAGLVLSPKQFDDDGNPISAVAETVIFATVSKKNQPGAVQNGNSGLDGQSILMTGRSVNPKLFDPSLLPRDCKAEITDPVTGQTLTGKAVLTLPLQSKFKAVTSALGTKIDFEFIETEGR